MNMTPFDSFDWFRRFFDRNNLMRTRGLGGWPSTASIFDIDPFREFEDMEREMERRFSHLNEISKNPPKELVREYETSEGGKVREVGPLVYGYSMTIGPDGKPKVTEFGNVKHPLKRITGLQVGPQITAEREPLADVNVTEKEVQVVLEMPGVKKDNIKINAFDGTVEVLSDDPQRKYHRTIELPEETDIETAKSTYNNGILEITFNKKKQAKPKGKEIKIE